MKVFKGKIRAAIGSLMDHAGTASTNASSAAIPDRALLADIETAIERSTGSGGGGHDDRHVHEILFLVSNAPGAITFLSRRITARLEAARAPAAALRSLLLVHRLLRAGDRYFEQDLRSLWASRDLRVGAPRCSCSPLAAGVDYVNAGAAAATGACAFVHGYSAYLEERMQWVINQAGNLEPARPSPPPHHDGKLPHPPSSSHDADVETLLFKLAMCQRLLDLTIQLLPDNNTSACAAARSAFGIVLRESFKVYDAFMEGLDAMLLRSRSLDGLSKPLRLSANEIMRKASAQTPELKEFYHKCKRSNGSKSLDYPLVRVVTPAQASEMEMESVPIPEEDCQEKEVSDGSGGAPLVRKMETTISTVWVEFDDDDQQIAGDGDHSLKAVQPS
ncbi:putative clathrin assembly protein At1g33340 [Phragmites australis]|uniref:putative clathrin assembly protein At1g33340 n=1 Tax=Phragmites australis TaxID=29695 RepID=UPI002D78A815|nr:putative clathrin assembly protein At1g33340 [Phragmites australis]